VTTKTDLKWGTRLEEGQKRTPAAEKAGGKWGKGKCKWVWVGWGKRQKKERIVSKRGNRDHGSHERRKKSRTPSDVEEGPNARVLEKKETRGENGEKRAGGENLRRVLGEKSTMGCPQNQGENGKEKSPKGGCRGGGKGGETRDGKLGGKRSYKPQKSCWNRGHRSSSKKGGATQ